MSKLAEIASLSTVEKPIFTPEQIAGHEIMWSEDNIKNYPYQLINPITDASGQEVPAGPIGYTKPPAIPQALAALMQLVDIDTKDRCAQRRCFVSIGRRESGIPINP